MYPVQIYPYQCPWASCRQYDIGTVCLQTHYTLASRACFRQRLNILPGLLTFSGCFAACLVVFLINHRIDSFTHCSLLFQRPTANPKSLLSVEDSLLPCCSLALFIHFIAVLLNDVQKYRSSSFPCLSRPLQVRVYNQQCEFMIHYSRPEI